MQFAKPILLIVLVVLLVACSPAATTLHPTTGPTRITSEPSAVHPTAEPIAIASEPSAAHPTAEPTTITSEPSAAHPTAEPTAITPEPSPSPSILLHLEKSSQQFTARETFQVGLGDLDGDGDLDAVLANPLLNHSQAWLNDGSGNLLDTGQELTQYGHGVGLADFDQDGDLDAFITCHNSILPSSVYLNDGNANFQHNGQDLGDKSTSGVDLNLLDLNNDGYTDVHVAYYDPNGMPDKVYLNDGSANFNDSGLALDEDIIAWGDLDGDGDVDYFGKRWDTGYVVQLNDGNGQFSEDWQMDDSQSTIGGIALADFDNDNDLDALVVNGFRDSGIFPSRLFLNDGHGQFTDSGQSLNETIGAELAVGDLDGNGDLDVFVANMDLPNEVWLNEKGIFTDSGLRLGKNEDLSVRPSLGDLDGDGDLDVVTGRFNGGAEIWFNTGSQGSSPHADDSFAKSIDTVDQ